MPKQNLKKYFSNETYGQKIQGFAEEVMKKLFGTVVPLERARDIVRNNYELGVSHLQRGNINDAVLRFKLVTWLDPGHVEGWYHLGRAWLAEGSRVRAEAALKKALSLKPEHEEAKYMLALAMGNKLSAEDSPRRIPPALAQNYFEQIAGGYAAEQEAAGYEGHTLLAAAIRTQLKEGRLDHVALDLGVGTGMAGPPLRDLCASITGVDFSEAMIRQAMQVKDAQGKKAYDELIRRDLQEFLNAAPPASYDIVLAANTLNYVGDLQPVFEQAARVLKVGGIFAFTVDTQKEPGWRFNAASGRFSYSKEHMQSLAASAKLQELVFEAEPIYPNYDMWVCVYRK